MSTLSDLLPSNSYTLAYTLPLIFDSLVLNFSGTFLTLDRTRTFPTGQKVYGTLSTAKRRRFTWALEGGIGGLASGYAFGLHIATLLSLLIPNTTSSAPLSPSSFVAVWVLSCTLATVCAARFRVVAVILPTLSAGLLAALFLSVLLHPPFLARHVLLAILIISLPLLLLLSTSPRCATLLHPVLRFSTAVTGTFGVILAIAILASPRIMPWANAWERLWVRDGAGWGTGKEKALNAAFCLFWCAGLATDWALRRWVGECPDEKWDNYLADYSAHLPNNVDRQGVFEPLAPRSLWDRLFSQAGNQTLRDRKETLFSDDLKLPPPSPYAPLPKLRKSSSTTPNSLPHPASFLKKERCGRLDFRRLGERRGRKPVKFGDISSDSEDEDDYDKKKQTRLSFNLRQTPSSASTPTLVNSSNAGDSRLALGKMDEENEYSDIEYEEDLGDPRRGAKGWRPPFMQHHSPPPGMVPVPATPSLIKAVQRVAEAQREAAVGMPVVELPRQVDDNVKTRSPRWEEFWREVRTKAQT